MKIKSFGVIFLLFLISVGGVAQEYALVVHGGAGYVHRGRYSAEKDMQFRQSLTRALLAGQELLASGKSSVDVVEHVISILENDSLFNAGRGAVLTAEGKVECDASIMDGKSKNAGAVAGVTGIKNPIRAARLVMDSSEHVMLSGAGAEEFARPYDLKFVDNNYFILESKRAKYLEKKKEKEKKHGTVGAVAIDQQGNIAAATSTGGMSGKAYGRIGDSPVIGAGTYADNNTCGVSCTGHGEFFIRYAVAHDLSAILEYTDQSLQEGAYTIIHKKLKPIDALGGLIAIDKNKNIVMEYNTEGMFRGYVTSDKIYVALYADE